MCAFSTIQDQRESQSTTFTSVARAMMRDALGFASHCLMHESGDPPELSALQIKRINEVLQQKPPALWDAW